eukprot:GFYU01037772.1.p1 GENE.GFYU01037772.1~~GFYU01037772.1.p1  ORF type:complete len:147 (-),score=14.50 GFYU01037772.1:203-643(-)
MWSSARHKLAPGVVLVLLGLMLHCTGPGVDAIEYIYNGQTNVERDSVVCGLSDPDFQAVTAATVAASPYDACDTLVNGAALDKKIALVDRQGSCAIEDKVEFGCCMYTGLSVWFWVSLFALCLCHLRDCAPTNPRHVGRMPNRLRM